MGLIEEGNDEDLGVAEYDFGARPQSARAAALQAKLRAEAKARLATGAPGLSLEEMIEALLKEYECENNVVIPVADIAPDRRRAPGSCAEAKTDSTEDGGADL